MATPSQAEASAPISQQPTMEDSASPGSISGLPVEIWTLVLALACTDDGSAGRNLSLVSRDWRAISAPFRLQSIALVGPKPILRFVSVLNANPDSHVQSLFVGCHNLRLYPASTRLNLAHERARGLEFTDKLFPELGVTASKETIQISPDKIEKALVRILELTSKTLQCLHTHLTLLERPAPLYSVPLPHLRTLVLHGPCASPPPTSSTFPQLRRLRIATPLTSPHKGSVLLSTVASAAPRLSHLCLSQSACSRKDLERALERTNLRNLTRLVVEVGTARRSRSPPGDPDSEPAGLIRLAQDDGRVRIVKERSWWIDVQAALIEWDQVDELRWDNRETVESSRGDTGH